MKSVVFLADGMADQPLEELRGKTPLEATDTPFMDRIADQGMSGTFLSLPDGFPTSSDVANMSVLGYPLAECYPGRGPIEAVSQDIPLADDDVAWRCNLITVKDSILCDYSAGHIDEDIARQLLSNLQANFGSDRLTFHSGVSYRNLLVLHGPEFSADVHYAKPDSTQGQPISDLKLRALNEGANETVQFLAKLMDDTAAFLSAHPLNQGKESPANYIWPWSPGHRPEFQPFAEKYAGKTGAVISAVDVIRGIGKCADMEVILVPGATGFVDTNYAGKAQAALEALGRHDFVYLHVEAIDECSHMGDLDLKLKAIADFENQIVKPVMTALEGQDVRFAVLPDHPVPIKLRKHTRTPVPFAVCGPGIPRDDIVAYSETTAPNGRAGNLSGDQFIKMVLDIQT